MALISNWSHNIHGIIKKSWEQLHVLLNNPKLPYIKPPKVVFKRCNTLLGGLLVLSKCPPNNCFINYKSKNKLQPNLPQATKAKLTPTLHKYFKIITLPFRCRPCMSSKLNTCPYITNTSTTINFTTQLPQNTNFNCASRNVVYLITCKKCGLQYVGETSCMLRERLSNHRC